LHKDLVLSASDASTVIARLSLAAAPASCTVAGQPSRELGPRDAALLAWLCIEGPTPRARLASLLWPDSDAEAARNALRQRLFQLRRQLGLDVATGAVTLALTAGIEHDLAQAQTVLGDSPHDHSEAFAQWLQAQRLQRSQMQSSRWAAEAETAERARDYDAALAWAQRLLAHEPASEVAHRRVMRLHYLRGDRAAALLAFDACERQLKDEVGTRPDAQTMSLLAMIESATTAAPPAPLRSLPPGVLRPPRLIARDEAVAAVVRPLAQGQHVLLLAEAGLGKTRLMEECAAALSAGAAATEGALVVARAGARAGDRARPFALLTRVLQVLVPPPAVLADEDRAALAWVMPDFGPPPKGALQLGPFEAAVAHVLKGTGVLFIDDLHHGDNASIELLLRCAAEPATRRCVMAVRPAELPAALQTWRDGGGMASTATEVTLESLDEAGVAALVDSLAVEGIDGAALAPALLRHTGGNPQFMLETLKALLLAQGGPGSSSAQDFASGNLPLPHTVARLIHQRLRQLSAGALKLARLAAVAGQDLSPALAASVLGQGLLDLADPWAELEAAGVLKGNTFAHDLVSEGTLETMPQVLAATLHAAVAQWLQAHGSEAARIAAHLRAAGHERDAVPWLMKAAVHASDRIQLRDAARFCEQAASICRAAGDAGGELDALQAEVDALFDVELGERMEQLLQRLQTMPLPAGQRARALCSVAAVRHFKFEHAAAQELGREALQLALDTEQPALEFRIRYGLVQVLSHLRDLPACEALLRPTRAWVATQSDELPRLQLACMEGWVQLASEHYETALLTWRSVERQAAAMERPREQAMALNHLHVGLARLGRFAEGHEAGLRELAIVRRHRLAGTRHIYLDLNLSISALLLGRYAESMAALERAQSQGVLDQGTLHLRRAALFLQLGQFARFLSELNPLLDGRVVAAPAVQFNARLLELRWLLQQDNAGSPARESAAAQALAAAAELAAVTQRVEHAARLLLWRARLAEPAVALPLLHEGLALAQRQQMQGLEVVAHAWLARALAVAADMPGAVEHIARALALREGGYVGELLPGVELDLIAVELLSEVDPPRAAALLAQAVQWLHRTAEHEVPEAYRHGFLHLQPVHRRLLAMKSPHADAAVPLQGQCPPPCSDNARSRP
jgi:DNA-binding SARP family transcriptional activator